MSYVSIPCIPSNFSLCSTTTICTPPKPNLGSRHLPGLLAILPLSPSKQWPTPSCANALARPVFYASHGRGNAQAISHAQLALSLARRANSTPHPARSTVARIGPVCLRRRSDSSNLRAGQRHGPIRRVLELVLQIAPYHPPHTLIPMPPRLMTPDRMTSNPNLPVSP